jgi:hypothetical protein
MAWVDLNTKASSNAASNTAFDSSGWVVNYGDAGTPSWVWAAALALAAFWLLTIKPKGA